MTPEGRQKLKALLLKHESYRQFPYVDTTGHLTIGIGRNLRDRGISLPEALYLSEEDMNYFEGKLSHSLKFWDSLSEERQIVLVDMCFNLGVQGLMGFKDMMLALECGNYEKASLEMMDSKWSEQVGERARSLSNIMRTGAM